MRSVAIAAIVVSAIAVFGTAAPANAASEYKVLNKFKLGGDGGWDYVTVDGASRRAFIARSDRVMVVDADKGTMLGEISGVPGVHGVAVVPALNRGFATSGKDNNVRIFDLKTLKQTGQVKAGIKPDAIIFDSGSGNIFAFNNGGTTATAIDPKAGKAVGDVELDGEPEAAVSDGKGKIYVNLEDKSEIAVIDSKKLKVIARWSLAPGEKPSGLAFDAKHKRLFSGCRNKLMIVVDSESGKVVDKLPIGKGVDGCGFDDQSQNAFSTNGADGTLTIVHENGADKFTVVDNLATQAGARTMGIDPKTHRIWTVTADFDQSGEPGFHDRRLRPLVPGSFSALVIGK
jgi:WD40 repeat protein